MQILHGTSGFTNLAVLPAHNPSYTDIVFHITILFSEGKGGGSKKPARIKNRLTTYTQTYLPQYF